MDSQLQKRELVLCSLSTYLAFKALAALNEAAGLGVPLMVFGSAVEGKKSPADIDCFIDLRHVPFSNELLGRYAPLLHLARVHYGSIDPFIVFADALIVRNDHASGWKHASHARKLVANMVATGVPIDRLKDRILVDAKLFPHVGVLSLYSENWRHFESVDAANEGGGARPAIYLMRIGSRDKGEPSVVQSLYVCADQDERNHFLRVLNNETVEQYVPPSRAVSHDHVKANTQKLESNMQQQDGLKLVAVCGRVLGSDDDTMGHVWVEGDEDPSKAFASQYLQLSDEEVNCEDDENRRWFVHTEEVIGEMRGGRFVLAPELQLDQIHEGESLPMERPKG